MNIRIIKSSFIIYSSKINFLEYNSTLSPSTEVYLSFNIFSLVNLLLYLLKSITNFPSEAVVVPSYESDPAHIFGAIVIVVGE